MVHRANTLARRDGLSLVRIQYARHLDVNTLTVLKCTGYVPMWEYFYLYNIFIFLIYTIYFCFFLTKDTIKEK